MMAKKVKAVFTKFFIKTVFIKFNLQSPSLQACVAAMYSASVVDKATTVCSFETQLTAAPA
ncbi:hypothetical protein CICLE_v100083382mg, partial [Citrus x clementina]